MECRFLGFLFQCLGAFVARLIIRLHKINVVDAESAGEMEQSNDGRVASSRFQIADILLGEA